ncbi:MAG: hypothetical protein A2622_11735 [Bdellovibrionales bacterium RIFCSPHIGHO2_01_FULL_40_29]|nr:MAG: hypothetical protein A2622_11735 [Bdellovibrionales bacterium RIFCSPHIGHO2_01_FULL_40_29]
MVANEARISAMEDRLEAARLSSMPFVSIGAGQSYNYSAGEASSQGRRVGISTSVSLFDGGAHRHAVAARESDLKASIAQYNSTSPMMSNTRASIAAEVLMSYVSIVELNERIRYLTYAETTLKLYLKVATAEEAVTIQESISELQNTLLTLKFSLRESEKGFKYYSTIPAPPFEQLQTIGQAIQSLGIPENAEEAFRIALDKNPDIKLAEYNLNSNREYSEAEKARHGLQVTASASVDRGGSSRRGYGTSASVGIQAQMTFDVSNRHSQRASEKSVAAAQSDLEGTIDEKKFKIESTYPLLQNQMDLYTSYLANLKTARENLDRVLAAVEAGESVDMIKVGIPRLNAFRSASSNTLSQQISILRIRFGIQQLVGTLFENLGIDTSVNSFSKSYNKKY